MFQNRDTIAAQATAAGEGGVAIVRVSGADCEAVVSRVFRAKNGKPLANRVLTYGCVMENGEIADEAMAVLMRAPHSYTRENVAEIHCHGSQALVRKILMLLMAAGVVTTIPLLCFTGAATRLRLSTLGFFQYIGPTLMFLLAVVFYGEVPGADKMVTFAFIWVALAIFVADAIYTQRRGRRGL